MKKTTDTKEELRYNKRVVKSIERKYNALKTDMNVKVIGLEQQIKELNRTIKTMNLEMKLQAKELREKEENTQNNIEEQGWV